MSVFCSSVSSQTTRNARRTQESITFIAAPPILVFDGRARASEGRGDRADPDDLSLARRRGSFIDLRYAIFYYARGLIYDF